jgi:curli biogenesis system outer membrane secretion channel CsgG
MRPTIVLVILAGALTLAACAKKDETKAVELAAPASKASPVSPLPDVGKIEHVQVSARGIGATPDAAVQEALRLAVMEVNGESVDAGSIAIKFGLDVAAGQTSESLRGSAFAEAVTSRSKGTISNFKLVSLIEPTANGQPYKADVEASIAKFTAPADSKKIKIVVSSLRISASMFDVGGIEIPASKIADEVRQRLIDALTATGRFSVLDRDFGPEVQSELDLIASGQTPSDEMAKLSQTLSADIVWVGTVNDFGYHRNARHLQMGDRDLVSYSGGWSVSHRILNISTRQIMLSDTLQDQLPPTEPTTMDRGVDGTQLAEKMESDVVSRTVAAILARTFPLVVVSKDGTDVILSQGGQAVKVGASYAIVSMGKELKDPQTGESLGRTEASCCDVVIDRVSSKLAYGHLENVKIALDSVDPVGLQVRDEMKLKMTADSPVAPPATQSQPASPPIAPRTVAVQTQLAAVPALPTESKSSDDSKKW